MKRLKKIDQVSTLEMVTLINQEDQKGSTSN